MKKIVDGHTHVASTKFLPNEFVQGVVDNIQVAMVSRGINAPRSNILDLYLSKLQDHDCTELIKEMDSADISASVLLLPDFTHVFKTSPLTIAEMFALHRDILTRHPGRFLVFAGVDPRWGKDGHDLFEKGIRDYGFKGLKLYPPCGYSPSDRSLYPFYELCRRYGVPVLTHVGGTSPALSFETAGPLRLDQAARDFPDVNFILAHGSSAYVEECVQMCAFRPNVYLDVSGYQSKPVSMLNQVLDAHIGHKIIFGTDWPVFRMQGSQSAHLARLNSAESHMNHMPLPDQVNIFANTILRLTSGKSNEPRPG